MAATTIQIKQISPDDAENLCRSIIKDLPEYFGLPECNEVYAKGVREHTNFAVQHQGVFVGLLSLAFPYPQTGQIYWMGILRQHQGKGLGRSLVHTAVQFAKQKGAKLLTVETLSKKASDENYLKTYSFYETLGFQPLFDLRPEGYEWVMVYMALSLSSFNFSYLNVGFELSRPSAVCSIKNAAHFSWGDGCDGWWLKEDSNFTVISERMPPNRSEKKHYHKETEQFFYCLSGTLLIVLEKQNHKPKAHNGITVPAGQAHQVQMFPIKKQPPWSFQ